MKTQLLGLDSAQKREDNLILAAKALQNGKLVVFPTETVYGIGADALNISAVANIFTAKGRPQDNPLIVHVADVKQIKPLVVEFCETAKLLAEKFWPGPLTIIFPKSELIPSEVSAGLDTVAIRIPSHPVAHELLKKAGIPVAAPSANRSGLPSPTTAQHCYTDLNGKVDIILDGGHANVGVESTVVAIENGVPVILRPGGVPLEDLIDAVGQARVSHAVLEELGKDEVASSPGMKYKHYSPKADVFIVHGNKAEYAEYCNKHAENNVWAMAFEEDMKLIDTQKISYGSQENLGELATNLFYILRQLDDIGAETIFVHAPSTKGIGLAVYNRLLRAAAFKEIHL